MGDRCSLDWGGGCAGGESEGSLEVFRDLIDSIW